MLAPPTITIEFYPESYMNIVACPVGIPSITSQFKATLDYYIYFARLSLKESNPTFPANIVFAPSLAAATAWFAPFPPFF